MLLNLVNFDKSMLKWCSLHTVNLGMAQWVAASTILELMAMDVTSLQ